MASGEYVPDAGHIVWLEFDPQAGHEQAGKRPALVITPAQYNGKSGLMLCVPLTTARKGYPFEVAVDGPGGMGIALADQAKSLDWRARNAKYAGLSCAPIQLQMVRGMLAALIAGA